MVRFDEPHGLQRMVIRQRRAPEREVRLDGMRQSVQPRAGCQKCVHARRRCRVDQRDIGTTALLMISCVRLAGSWPRSRSRPTRVSPGPASQSGAREPKDARAPKSSWVR
jgi:hypothetical protein